MEAAGDQTGWVKFAAPPFAMIQFAVDLIIRHPKEAVLRLVLEPRIVVSSHWFTRLRMHGHDACTNYKRPDDDRHPQRTHDINISSHLVTFLSPFARVQICSRIAPAETSPLRWRGRSGVGQYLY